MFFFRATLALLALGVAGGCSEASDDDVRAFLFLIDAPTAEVLDTATGQELVVPLDKMVTWFTDRPFRESGHLSLQRFIDDWSAEGYADDAPEAAIEVVVSGEAETFIVELGIPAVVDGAVHMPVSVIAVPEGATAQHAGRSATSGLVTGPLENVFMFIESTRTCAACKVVAP